MQELLTVRELAKILKLSEPGLRQLVRQNKIPHLRLGTRAIRFDPEAIDHWRRQFFETGGMKSHEDMASSRNQPGKTCREQDLINPAINQTTPHAGARSADAVKPQRQPTGQPGPAALRAARRGMPKECRKLFSKKTNKKANDQ